MAEPTREEIDAQSGVSVLEFGATWCGICQGTRPLLDRVFSEHAGVPRVWIEDGKGKRLGRSFGIKLWPTLVFLREGKEVARVVRPTNEGELNAAFAALNA